MDRLKTLLRGILIVLFVEGICLVPVVIMVASSSDVSRTLKYLVPDLLAIAPYAATKLTKANIEKIRESLAVMLAANAIAACFLLYFTALTFVSCAGHPPY